MALFLLGRVATCAGEMGARDRRTKHCAKYLFHDSPCVPDSGKRGFKGEMPGGEVLCNYCKLSVEFCLDKEDRVVPVSLIKTDDTQTVLNKRHGSVGVSRKGNRGETKPPSAC